MKISQQEIKSQQEVPYDRPRQVPTQSFQKLVNSQAQHLKQEELSQLIARISNQGAKVARYRTLRELAKFKRLIKSFLQETVSTGYELKHGHTLGFDGSSRKLTTLKELDDKLLQLTEDLMNQEKKTVDLLDLIGEIKGLLLDIYS